MMIDNVAYCKQSLIQMCVQNFGGHTQNIVSFVKDTTHFKWQRMKQRKKKNLLEVHFEKKTMSIYL